MFTVGYFGGKQLPHPRFIPFWPNFWLPVFTPRRGFPVNHKMIFRPSAAKSGRPYGVMYVSSWGDWGSAGGGGVSPYLGPTRRGGSGREAVMGISYVLTWRCGGAWPLQLTGCDSARPWRWLALLFCFVRVLKLGDFLQEKLCWARWSCVDHTVWSSCSRWNWDCHTVLQSIRTVGHSLWNRVIRQLVWTKAWTFILPQFDFIVVQAVKRKMERDLISRPDVRIFRHL